MSTVIAFECDGGAVVAADRTIVRGGTVASENRNRLLEFEGCGGAALGDPDRVRRELDAGLRKYRDERGHPPDIDAFAAIAERVVDDVGTDAALAGRDDNGVARVVAVYADGSILTGSPLALGTGAAGALGRLEGADTDVPLEEAGGLATAVLEDVAERDTGTGTDIDVFQLASVDAGDGADS